MSEKFGDGEFWLPAEFLDEDFFLKDSGLAVSCDRKTFYAGDSVESESEEEEYMAGLTQQMAQSYLLGDNGDGLAATAKNMATSPQSTLCDSRIWSASSQGSPNGPSQVSSPPSTPFEQRKDDAWDLLYAAAGEVGKMKQNEQKMNGSGLLIPSKKPSEHVAKESLATHYRSYNPILAQQQLQAAQQFYQLKHQQLIKQQVSAAWGRQNRAARNGKPFCSASAWPPLLRAQPGSGMRALFLNSSGSRRESAGTGVFLPRRSVPCNEVHKKPACSTVLLPAKVVQALNKFNLEDSVAHPRYSGYFSLDQEIAANRGNLYQKGQYHHPPPPIVSSHEIQLPQEWTY